MGKIGSKDLVGLQAVVNWPTIELKFTPAVSSLFLDIRMEKKGDNLEFWGFYSLSERDQRARFQLTDAGIDSVQEAAMMRCVWRESDGTTTTIPMMVVQDGRG